MASRSVPVIEGEAVVSRFLSDSRSNLTNALDARFGIPSVLLSGDADALNGGRSRDVSPLAILHKSCRPAQLQAALADAFAPG